MRIIIAPIIPGESSPAVVNLQDALLALLKRDDVFPVRVAPESPTAEELQKLAEALQQERVDSFYGGNTQQVVFILQVDQGLGDNLRDVGVTKAHWPV